MDSNQVGYFGVMMPAVSVKQCHFKRYYNYIKNIIHRFFNAPFLNDFPFLWMAIHKTGESLRKKL